MYKNHFAVAIKANNHVLQESGDRVTIPFNSEYSVSLHNMESRRVQVRVSIDGQDAAGALIIGANQLLDLERFIKDGNLASGHRFKFIPRTDKIEKHRGIRAEDGLVRVEFCFEKEKPQIVWPIGQNYYYYPWHIPYPLFPTIGAVKSNSYNILRSSSAVSENGITVSGSVSNQQFVPTAALDLETQSHVIVLHLVGAVDGKTVKTAVAVKTKQTCETCGTKTKVGTAQYCGHCGTSLSVI